MSLGSVASGPVGRCEQGLSLHTVFFYFRLDLVTYDFFVSGLKTVQRCTIRLTSTVQCALYRLFQVNSDAEE